MPAKRSARRKVSSRSSRVSFLTFLTGFLKNHFLLLTLLLLLTLTVGGLATANLSGRSSAAGSIRDLMKFKLSRQDSAPQWFQKCASQNSCYVNKAIAGQVQSTTNECLAEKTAKNIDGVCLYCETKANASTGGGNQVFVKDASWCQEGSQKGGASKARGELSLNDCWGATCAVNINGRKEFNLNDEEKKMCQSLFESQCSTKGKDSCGENECEFDSYSGKICKSIGSCDIGGANKYVWCRCVGGLKDRNNNGTYDADYDCTYSSQAACLGQTGNQGKPQPTNPPASVGCASGWTCNGNCALQNDVNMFTETWCDPKSRWLYEAAGNSAACGGSESKLKSQGC